MKKSPRVLILIAAVVLVILGSAGWIGQSWATNDGPDRPTTTTVFRVEGMTCGGCEAGVEIVVKKLDGVASVDASFEDGTAAVTYDPESVTPEEIVAAIETLGYEAAGAETSTLGGGGGR